LSEGDLVIRVHGEELALMPERCVFWRAKETLLIADPHSGKAATFRAGGIPVPTGTTDEALSRLQRAMGRATAKRIVFLGDLLHAKAGRSRSMLQALGQWRSANSTMEVLLVRGNHDRRAGDPPGDLRIDCVDAPYVMRPFILAHHPVAIEGEYVIAGHVHPGVRLYGAGRQRVRLPCFVFGSAGAILPAFGDFTGFADSEPEADSGVYAIAGETVIEIKIDG